MAQYLHLGFWLIRHTVHGLKRKLKCNVNLDNAKLACTVSMASSLEISMASSMASSMAKNMASSMAASSLEISKASSVVCHMTSCRKKRSYIPRLTKLTRIRK